MYWVHYVDRHICADSGFDFKVHKSSFPSAGRNSPNNIDMGFWHRLLTHQRERSTVKYRIAVEYVEADWVYTHSCGDFDIPLGDKIF